MKSIINRVMSHPAIQAKPPVLVDVGASGELPTQWKLLAAHSICVAFDADTRDFEVKESENGTWKKLYSLNRLVAAKSNDSADFFLTKSPYCSSTLHPDPEGLKPWAYNALFEVEKVIQMPATDLQTVLGKIGLDYIDWYQTDSQGTDVRIFAALPSEIIEKMLVAEFEPGMLNAYVGEDKLHHLMAYMEGRPFWISHIRLAGSHRIDQQDLLSLNGFQRRRLSGFLKMAPGWGEISYVNAMGSPALGCREYLLAWVFSVILKEHGFGLHVAREGAERFKDPLFDELFRYSRRSLSSPAAYGRLALKAVRKLLRLGAKP